MSDALIEEFEVLESIYPSELTKISDSVIQIDVEPEEVNALDGAELLRLTLQVEYGPDYPDVLPKLSLYTVEDGGEIDDNEIALLLKDLQSVGEENVGIAMTFTLVSHLREHLASFVKDRAERRRREETEKERLALEAEEARTRGTAVTQESFKAWKIKFDQEQAAAKRASRQLFEGNRILEEDSLMEEGTISVDLSQYDRTSRGEDPEEEEGITFSDSD
ncbi:RWD-domain-containing protein [Mycena amicta]|nr:RWD-domain-containing protein [Mycena amicta]